MEISERFVVQEMVSTKLNLEDRATFRTIGIYDRKLDKFCALETAEVGEDSTESSIAGAKLVIGQLLTRPETINFLSWSDSSTWTKALEVNTSVLFL